MPLKKFFFDQRAQFGCIIYMYNKNLTLSFYNKSHFFYIYPKTKPNK